MDAELQLRASALADSIALGWSGDPADAIQLGIDLLTAGFDGPRVVALASVVPGTRWVDVEPVAVAALQEIGFDIADRPAKGWDLALYLAKQLKRGGPRVHHLAAALWGLLCEIGTQTEISALVLWMDAFEETVPAERGPIVAELQTLADPIIARAETALTGKGNRDDQTHPTETDR